MTTRTAARKAAKAKRPAKRRASAATVTAAKARDAAVNERGAAALAAPGLGERLAPAPAPLFARYSVRNLALLFDQAAERGMDVTDVATYRQWQERGRQVQAGAVSFKLVKPVGGRPAKDTPDTEAITPDGDDREADDDFTAFRVFTVFDISQTKGIEDFEGETGEPAPTGQEAEAVKFENLAQEAAKAGYLVAVHDDDATAGQAPVAVLPEESMIRVYDRPGAIPALVDAVAQVITAETERKHAARHGDA